MQTICHRNPIPHSKGELYAEYDLVSGSLSARSSGYLEASQVKAFFEDWRGVVRALHSSARAVSALVDLTDTTVQNAEVVHIIATATMGLYRAGDAVAMLMPTSLAKMQMRRVLDARYHEFFISRSAAEHWREGRSARRDGIVARTAAC